MKKKALVSAAALLLCAALALCGYKASRILGEFRARLSAIEEAVSANSDYIDNANIIAQSVLSKAGADMGVYSFDYSWLEEPCLIAHALGGIDGHDYTNSMEALELAYENGLRVFEGDMQLLDGRVVMMHDEAGFCEASGLTPGEFGYDEFMQAKLHGSYSTMDAADIIRFLSEHPDAWFMTDSKYRENPKSAAILSAFVLEAMEYDSSVLDRVIVQVYNQNMLETAMDIYPFSSVLYTLYGSPDTDAQVLSFCLRSGVSAVTAPIYRMTEDFSAALNAAGIKSLVHTVNDADEINAFVDTGVSGIYTDFALPADLK